MTPEVDYKGVFNAGSALYLILLPDEPKFTIAGASDVYLEATMRKREDIVGKGVFEAYPPNPADTAGIMEKTFRAAFKRVIETKKIDVMPVQQYDIPKPDGGFDIRYWSVTHSPILDAKGRLIQMAQRVEDVTELVELKQHGDRMETEVMLRAREIKEASNKLAEVNKDLEAFSYSVSHDLRTPLRSMVAFGDLLLTEHQASLNKQGQDYLKRIVSAGKRMGLLIDGLLSLARLTREEIQRENVDLSSLAEALREQLMTSEPTRKVEFEIAPDMHVIGDARLLEVAMQNLLNNAWKFTSQKNPAKIQVGVAVQKNEKIFFVKDNGAGFDMQYAGRLFNAFQRLHSESEFNGTGIGLATVHKIITRHGGRVWAQSTLDEGTTFYFTLAI